MGSTAFLWFVLAQIKISLHVAYHQDHLYCKGNLLSEAYLVCLQQNTAHFRWKEQNQEGCWETCETFSKIVELFPFIVVAEVGGQDESDDKEEMCLILDSLIAEKESKCGYGEYGCVENGCFSMEIHDDK